MLTTSNFPHHVRFGLFLRANWYNKGGEKSVLIHCDTELVNFRLWSRNKLDYPGNITGNYITCNLALQVFPVVAARTSDQFPSASAPTSAGQGRANASTVQAGLPGH